MKLHDEQADMNIHLSESYVNLKVKIKIKFSIIRN